jgi:hypothetical protein
VRLLPNSQEWVSERISLSLDSSLTASIANCFVDVLDHLGPDLACLASIAMTADVSCTAKSPSTFNVTARDNCDEIVSVYTTTPTVQVSKRPVVSITAIDW